jgi:hypothetical protein
LRIGNLSAGIGPPLLELQRERPCLAQIAGNGPRFTPSTGWPPSIGIGGRFGSDWVAAFRRNHWPLCLGFRKVGTALRFIDKRRVLIISRDQTLIDTTTDVKIIKYGQEPGAMTRLRRDIGGWAGRTLPGGRSKMVVANVVLICTILLAVVLEFALGFLLGGILFSH